MRLLQRCLAEFPLLPLFVLAVVFATSARWSEVAAAAFPVAIVVIRLILAPRQHAQAGNPTRKSVNWGRGAFAALIAVWLVPFRWAMPVDLTEAMRLGGFVVVALIAPNRCIGWLAPLRWAAATAALLLPALLSGGGVALDPLLGALRIALLADLIRTGLSTRDVRIDRLIVAMGLGVVIALQQNLLWLPIAILAVATIELAAAGALSREARAMKPPTACARRWISRGRFVAIAAVAALLWAWCVSQFSALGQRIHEVGPVLVAGALYHARQSVAAVTPPRPEPRRAPNQPKPPESKLADAAERLAQKPNESDESRPAGEGGARERSPAYPKSGDARVADDRAGPDGERGPTSSDVSASLPVAGRGGKRSEDASIRPADLARTGDGLKPGSESGDGRDGTAEFFGPSQRTTDSLSSASGQGDGGPGLSLPPDLGSTFTTNTNPKSVGGPAVQDSRPESGRTEGGAQAHDPAGQPSNAADPASEAARAAPEPLGLSSTGAQPGLPVAMPSDNVRPPLPLRTQIAKSDATGSPGSASRGTAATSGTQSASAGTESGSSGAEPSARAGQAQISGDRGEPRSDPRGGESVASSGPNQDAAGSVQGAPNEHGSRASSGGGSPAGGSSSGGSSGGGASGDGSSAGDAGSGAGAGATGGSSEPPGGLGGSGMVPPPPHAGDEMARSASAPPPASGQAATRNESGSSSSRGSVAGADSAAQPSPDLSRRGEAATDRLDAVPGGSAETFGSAAAQSAASLTASLFQSLPNAALPPEPPGAMSPGADELNNRGEAAPRAGTAAAAMAPPPPPPPALPAEEPAATTAPDSPATPASVSPNSAPSPESETPPVPHVVPPPPATPNRLLLQPWMLPAAFLIALALLVLAILERRRGNKPATSAARLVIEDRRKAGRCLCEIEALLGRPAPAAVTTDLIQARQLGLGLRYGMDFNSDRVARLETDVRRLRRALDGFERELEMMAKRRA